MQVAYELLSPLDPTAQQRVMAWLLAALADENGAPTAVDERAAPVRPTGEVPAEIALGDSTAEHAPAVPEAETAAPTAELAAAAEPEVAVEPGPVAEPAPDPQPPRGRPAKTTGRRPTKAAGPVMTATPAPAAATPSRRSDRPGGDQLLADLAAAGSFTALAEKYGKSIGTIGNWANQLRK